ncbi:hypothetical protein CHS0354_042939 [Potamilus streckersoni]|uniref:Uncharacterized protein n=1 Tax=Potamilus streckersoni TaxID=2493646 RepID=A0AAE0W7H0_9BIVA|nr:hypothetical protein CHS0354_042939 [Potamilus streckersoni]
MGNSTSTKLTRISKSNRKSKLGRLGKIFQCFKGEQSIDEKQKDTNAIDFEEPCPEQRKAASTIPIILPSDKVQETDSYKVFHEKLRVIISINDFELSDNVSTGATPEMRPGDSFMSQPKTIDRPRQSYSSPNGNYYQPLRDISEQAIYTRDRRLGPKAAKGNSTHFISNNVDIYLPGAVFAINAEDQLEGCNMKKMQD